MGAYVSKAMICSLIEALSLTFLVGPYLSPKYSRKISYLLFFIMSAFHDAYFSMYAEKLPVWATVVEVAVFYPLFALFIHRSYHGKTFKNYCMVFAYRSIYQLTGMFSSMIPILWINKFDMNAAYEWVNGDNYNGLVLMLICYMIMFPACYVLFKWHRSKEHKGTMILFVVLAIFDFIWLVAPTIGVITILPIITMGIISIFYLLQQREEAETAETYRYYSKILEQTKKQELKLSVVRHDLANHLSAIESLESDKEATDIIDSLDKLKHNWTQIPILDCLLAEKKRIAEQKGIDLNIESLAFSAGQEAQINLVTILSNMIDNGIESCERVLKKNGEGRGKPSCDLRIENSGEYLCINLENDKLPDEKPLKTGFKTTKKDRENHGYGHRIVKRAVANMEGDICFEDKNDRFNVRVLVKLKPESEKPKKTGVLPSSQ